MTNIYELVFPEELAGVEVDGIDVQMLALDAIRLVDYFTRESEFTQEQYTFFLEIQADLPKVIEGVESEHQDYFKTIQKTLEDIASTYQHESNEN